MADFTGTNGNDFFAFQGAMEHITLNIVDPYTGESFFVDDDFNANTATYEGLAGIDTIFMTNSGDALFLTSRTTGDQTVFNVEVFFAGDGGDVLHLASTTYTLGDITVDGGASADLVLSNAGDDVLNGRAGEDIMNGGPGNDILNGGDDADRLNGGSDADILNGEGGDDTLIFFADMAAPEGWYAWNVGSPGVAGTSTLVNISGTNLSQDIFDGGDGFDTIQMTDGDDSLFLDDPYNAHHPDAGSLQLIGIEQINAGDGHDMVDLTHTDIDYGDIIINGEGGNDHLWAASGNDILNGGDGNDHLFGGFGEDELNGDNGDDELYGSLGNDILRGGAGNDILYGGAGSSSEYVEIIEKEHIFNNTVVFPNLQETVSILDLVPPGDSALGIAAGDLSVDFATTAEVTFLSTGAGYNNSLGFYNISAHDGTIMSVELAFPNVKDYAAGSSATIDLPGDPDTDFGFFIIPDGDRHNGFSDLDLENGTLQFIYKHDSAHERAATIYDDAQKVTLVYSNGSEEVVLKSQTGPHGIYHTTTRGGDTNLNHDGEVHVVSGLITDGDDTKLRIGFEDLKHTGDADYNDVVFDLSVASQTEIIVTESDGDMLFGGAGDDIMDGGIGDDLLVGGEGMDTLYGDQGADTFLFQSMADAGDTIMDFELGVDGDNINITDILDGFDSSDDINDFARLIENGSDVELHINADGQGTDFAALVTITGGLGGAGLSDLLADGNLIVDQIISV